MQIVCTVYFVWSVLTDWRVLTDCSFSITKCLDRLEILDRPEFLDRLRPLDRLELFDRQEFLDRLECLDSKYQICIMYKLWRVMGWVVVYLDYSVSSGPFLRFSMRFEFLSEFLPEMFGHLVCETGDPSLTIAQFLWEKSNCSWGSFICIIVTIEFTTSS